MKAKLIAATVFASVTTGPVFAQAVDISAVETELAFMPITASAIGAGLAIAAVAAVSWKWVKGALFS